MSYIRSIDASHVTDEPPQRVSSLPSTRSSARTDTRRQRLSTRPSRRLPSLYTPSSANTGESEHQSYSVIALILFFSMDYMFNACSTTARRGALDWAPVFEKANVPVFEALYESVRNGTETRKSLEFNGRSTYREDLAKELKEINEQEIWVAGKTVRSLRPDSKPE